MGSPKKQAPKSVATKILESVTSSAVSIATKEFQQRKLLPDLLRKASRASYLLNEIAKGNQQAMNHAHSSSLELRMILEDMGVELDWKT